MELASVNSAFGALVAGLVTSLHCAGMCGPLACVVMSPRDGDGAGRSDPVVVGSIYHLTRLVGYAVLGGIAGGIGRLPLTWVSQPALRWLPWATVLVLVALAFRWDRYLPRIAALGRWSWKLHLWQRSRSRWQAAAVFGLATPLLPCGPLYFLVALTVFSGSALRGVEFMLAFGLGTVPLLWIAQTQIVRIRAILSPRRFDRVRMAMALTAAIVISWRLRGTLGLGGADPSGLVCF